MIVEIPGTNLFVDSEANDPSGNGEKAIEVYAMNGESAVHAGLFVTLHNSAGWKINLANPAAGAAPTFDISEHTGKVYCDGIGLPEH